MIIKQKNLFMCSLSSELSTKIVDRNLMFIKEVSAEALIIWQ